MNILSRILFAISLSVFAGYIATPSLAGPYEDGLKAYKAENYTHMLTSFQMSAEQGNMNGQYMLGLVHYSGTGTEKSMVKAEQWFRKASEQGHRLAQYNLGNIYFHGTGFDKNAKEAEKWFRKSAEQGYKKAQFNLGLFYANGMVVPLSLETAADWFEKAAEQKLPEAMYSLGRLNYDYDIGVDYLRLNPKLYWYQQAAKRGHQGAIDALKIIETKKTVK